MPACFVGIAIAAQIRPRQHPGAKTRHAVATVTAIERPDDQGHVRNPRVRGVTGLVRRARRIAPGDRGTRAGWHWVTPLVRRLAFDHAHGLAWLRHEVGEVGAG